MYTSKNHLVYDNQQMNLDTIHLIRSITIIFSLHLKKMRLQFRIRFLFGIILLLEVTYPFRTSTTIIAMRVLLTVLQNSSVDVASNHEKCTLEAPLRNVCIEHNKKCIFMKKVEMTVKIYNNKT